MKNNRFLLILGLLLHGSFYAASNNQQNGKKYPELPLKFMEIIKNKDARGYLDLSFYLHKHPDNVEATTPAGEPLVVYAVDNPQALALVLNHKPDLNRRNQNGVPALIQAVRYEQEESVRLLVAAKADVGATIPQVVQGIPYTLPALHFAEWGLRRQCATANQIVYSLFTAWPRVKPAEGPKRLKYEMFERMEGYLINPGSAQEKKSEEKKDEGKR